MKKALIALSLAGFLLTAQAEQASADSIKKLMVSTGADVVGTKAIDNMIAQLKPLLPAAPASFWADIKKDTQPDDLIALLIPIYQQQLTESQVQAALAFFQSPEGKKFVAAQPIIHQKSMQAVQDWGKAFGHRIVEKYQKDHPAPEKQDKQDKQP